MTERTRASNWLAVVLAIAVSGVFVTIGSRMVWNSQRVVVARSAIYREMVAQKRLGTRRDELMNTVAGLKATTRMESRARMLGLGAPADDNVIYVQPEEN